MQQVLLHSEAFWMYKRARCNIDIAQIYLLLSVDIFST